MLLMWIPLVNKFGGTHARELIQINGSHSRARSGTALMIATVDHADIRGLAATRPVLTLPSNIGYS